MAIAPIIPEDVGVVEAQVSRDAPRFKDADRLGIVSGSRFASGGGDKHDAEGMLARIAIGGGVNVELFHQLHRQTRFLLRLPPRCHLDCFAVIDKTAGNRPAVGGIAALDQEDGAVGTIDQLDNDIDGWDGIAVSHRVFRVEIVEFGLEVKS